MKSSKRPNFRPPSGLSREEQAAYEEAALKQGSGLWPGKNPEPGISLVGEYVSMVEVPNTLGRRGEMQRKYTLRREDGSTISMFGSTVLNSEMDGISPAVGDKLLILYKGVSESHKKGQNPAKLFSVVKVATRKGKR